MQILHGEKICPAADILASHTPYLHKVSHFLSIKGVGSEGYNRADRALCLVDHGNSCRKLHRHAMQAAVLMHDRPAGRGNDFVLRETFG